MMWSKEDGIWSNSQTGWSVERDGGAGIFTGLYYVYDEQGRPKAHYSNVAYAKKMADVIAGVRIFDQFKKPKAEQPKRKPKPEPEPKKESGGGAVLKFPRTLF